MYAATAMELEPSAAPIGGAGMQDFSEKDKTDQASPTLIGGLMGQVRALFAKAEEIEQQVRKLEQECLGDEEAQNDIAHARMQAQTMLSTAHHINAELNGASNSGRNGQKKISASRLNTLSCTAEQVIHSADREKSALTAALEEVRTHQSQTKAVVASKANPEKTSVISVVRRAARAITPAAAPGALMSEIATPTLPLRQVQHQFYAWQQSAQEIGTRISHATTQAMQNMGTQISQVTTQAVHWVESTATAVVETGKKAAEKTKTAVQEYVAKLKDTVVAGAKSAYQATTQTAGNTVESVKTGAAQAKQWMSAQFQEKKAVVLAWLPFTEAPKPAAKPALVVVVKPAAPGIIDNMTLAARKQALAAMASLTALVQEGHNITDKFDLSAPILPKINAAISGLSLWN